ncbi:hypothetical protein BCR36DRAFT_373544 [Piromyces finnis]|uniref:Uncharacterized protein n=1 Tax=Piromyces finnis TaxID=1754191 RepID=A0A1Y1V0S4_9FUNG|nr:hypothetical protein BCR36DRAFT_373544 [Piromyces finnis]|eukprot:ORX44063.1 hypothetical protein BCR36DRAFT_373544 [Piromyces finnis]
MESLEQLIENIEKFGNNINKSYFSRFIKLSKALPTNFAEECLEKLPKLPIKDPREDFQEQNEDNKIIYKNFIEIIYKTIAEIEGSKSMKEDLKSFVHQRETTNKVRKEQNTKYAHTYKSKPETRIKYHKTASEKGRQNPKQITRKNILDDNIKDKQKSKLTQEFIHNTIESIKNSKYLNNPKFGGRMHYNKAVIIDNKYTAKYAIVLLDSRIRRKLHR